MSRFLPLLIALGVSGFVRAEEPDAIRAELNKAKQTFTDTTTKAKTTLLAAFDDAIKTVAAAGDLDGVKAIQNDRKVFEESGKTPTSAKLGTAVGEYTRATKVARAALDKAYDQTVKEYTKALKIELAEAVRREWKESIQPPLTVKSAAIIPAVKDPIPAPVSKLLKERADLSRRLSETTWTWGDAGNRVKFCTDGTVEFLASELKGTWVAVSGSEVIVAWSTGSHDKLTFDLTTSTMKKIWLGDPAGKTVENGKLIKK